LHIPPSIGLFLRCFPHLVLFRNKSTIEPPAQNELFASGDHYLLYLTLKKMGFQPPSDAMEIYQMAEQILAEGWDE